MGHGAFFRSVDKSMCSGSFEPVACGGVCAGATTHERGRRSMGVGAQRVHCVRVCNHSFVFRVCERVPCVVYVCVLHLAVVAFDETDGHQSTHKTRDAGKRKTPLDSAAHRHCAIAVHEGGGRRQGHTTAFSRCRTNVGHFFAVFFSCFVSVFSFICFSWTVHGAAGRVSVCG